MPVTSRHVFISIAVLLSLAVHAGAAWYWLVERHPDTTRQTDTAIEMNVTVTRVAAALPSPPPEPQPAPPPVTDVPAPAPVLKQAPVPTASIEPEPRPVAEQIVHEQPGVQAEPVPARIQVEAKARPSLWPRYRERLLAHMESHKFYPAAARRMRLQGDVAVALTIGCDGGVLESAARGETVLLERAASRALQRALPLPEPPPGVKCPLTLDYVMVYRLR